jgi:hypothetical protein
MDVVHEMVIFMWFRIPQTIILYACILDMFATMCVGKNRHRENKITQL